MKEIQRILAKARLSSAYCASEQIFAELEAEKSRLSVSNLLTLFEISQMWRRKISETIAAMQPFRYLDCCKAREPLHFLETDFLQKLDALICGQQTVFRHYMMLWQEYPEKAVHKLLLLEELYSSRSFKPQDVSFAAEMREDAANALNRVKQMLNV